MSSNKAPLSDIRLNLGYIKPGEQYNKPLFWGNIIIFVSLVCVVGFLFACHNKRDASSSLQDRDLMYFAILSAVILGFFALPINIWDGLSYRRKGVYSVSRHPIYAFLIALSILLLFSVGIYYASEGKDESSQKTLLILSMIALGLIIIVCLVLFWIVNYPYGWWARLFNAQVLGDEELYAINSDLFTEYIKERNAYDAITKYINGEQMNEKDYNQLYIDKKIIDKIKNDTYENIKNKDLVIFNTIRTLLITSEEQKDKNKAYLYNLGEFKSSYNYEVAKIESEGLLEGEKKRKIYEKYIELREKKNYFFKNTDLPKDIMKELADAINKSTDGRITTTEYNKIFGYYDNTTGVTNVGIVKRIDEMKNKVDKSKIDSFLSEFNSQMYSKDMYYFDNIKGSSDEYKNLKDAIEAYANKNIIELRKRTIPTVVTNSLKKFEEACKDKNFTDIKINELTECIKKADDL